MLYIMVGMPGSGKSHIANYLAKMLNCEIVSSDDKRAEWYGNAEDQSHNKELFARIDKLVSNLLAEGKSVILDATNISRKSRRRFLLKGKQHNIETVAIVVHTPIEIAKVRNFQRDRKVPESVIERQYQNFQMPTKEEGFDSVFVIDNVQTEI